MKTLIVLSLAAIVAAIVVAGCSQSEPANARADESPAPAKSASDQTPPAPGDAAPSATLVDFTNDRGELVCPVSGDVVTSKDNPAGYADHDGKRYYFCCASCPPTFKADPDKYADGKAIKSGEAKSMH